MKICKRNTIDIIHENLIGQITEEINNSILEQLKQIYLKYELDLTNVPTVGNFDINKLKNKRYYYDFTSD